MIVINDVNSQKFSFNGIEYFKNFTPVVIGDKVRILNAYDSAIELTSNPTLFSDFVVDGNTFLTVSALQTALLPVLYTRSTLGGGASAFTDLTDVPSAYTGQGGKVVSVKGTEDGLEFTTGGGGSSNLAFYQIKYTSNPTLNTTTETFHDSILIPANTIEDGDKVVIKFASNSDKVVSATFLCKMYVSTTNGDVGVTGNRVLTTNLNGTNSFGVSIRNFIYKSGNLMGLNDGTSTITDYALTANAIESWAHNFTVDKYFNFSIQDLSASNTADIIWIEVLVYKNS